MLETDWLGRERFIALKAREKEKRPRQQQRKREIKKLKKEGRWYYATRKEILATTSAETAKNANDNAQ